jgi:hypothetical protein
MVTITGYRELKNSTDETFFALLIQGDIELIKSSITGKLYATARKVMITSTFDELTCKALIGKQLPGSIKKVTCNAYDYTIPQTKEVIKLTFCYEYSSDPVSVEVTVFEMA